MLDDDDDDDDDDMEVPLTSAEKRKSDLEISPTQKVYSSDDEDRETKERTPDDDSAKDEIVIEKAASLSPSASPAISTLRGKKTNATNLDTSKMHKSEEPENKNSAVDKEHEERKHENESSNVSSCEATKVSPSSVSLPCSSSSSSSSFFPSSVRSGANASSAIDVGPRDDTELEQKKKKKRKTVSNETREKMKGQGPKSRIFYAMYKVNRPGNVANVEQWLGHKIPKGIVQNTLEEIAKNGDIVEKTGKNGQNKVWFFNQNLFKSKGLDMTKVIAQMEDDKEALDEVTEEMEGKRKILRTLEAQPTDLELEVQVKTLEQESDDLRARIATAEGSSVVMTPQEREKRRKEYFKFRAEWVKRKRQCVDLVGALADGMEKKSKEVESLLGIQTDLDVGIERLPPADLLGKDLKARPVVRYMNKKRK